MPELADRWKLDPIYFWMREDWRPRQPVEIADNGVVHVYGHAECVEVYANPLIYSSKVEELLLGVAEDGESLTEGALSAVDPPVHTTMRKIVSSAFTPRMVAALEPAIVAITTELLDAVDGRDDLELIEDFAYPMPVIVIADLLGVPRSDRVLFKEWVDRIVAAEGEVSMESTDVRRDDENVAAATGQVPELIAYLSAQIAERRRKPREDLLTRLVEAEVDGHRLTDAAAVIFARELLVAGHLTTSATLGNLLLCLDEHPEQMARLRADPSLAPGVIEETLRFLTPLAGSGRASAADSTLGGVEVPKGRLVRLWLGAANRDPRAFDRPEVFDPDRDPNPHLGLGRGVHFCIGAPLARLESRIGVNILLDRFPRLRRDPDRPVEFRPSEDVLGVTKLPMLTS